MPEQLEDVQNCRTIIKSSLVITKQTSEMTLYAKRIGDKVYVGASVSLRQLEDISPRYYYVERHGGHTPTKVFIVLAYNADEFILFNQEVICAVLNEILPSVWEDIEYPDKINHYCLQVNPFTVKLCKANPRVETYKTIERLVSAFNSCVQHGKKNKDFCVAMSLKQSLCLSRYYGNTMLIKVYHCAEK